MTATAHELSVVSDRYASISIYVCLAACANFRSLSGFFRVFELHLLLSLCGCECLWVCADCVCVWVCAVCVYMCVCCMCVFCCLCILQIQQKRRQKPKQPKKPLVISFARSDLWSLLSLFLSFSLCLALYAQLYSSLGYPLHFRSARRQLLSVFEGVQQQQHQQLATRLAELE